MVNSLPNIVVGKKHLTQLVYVKEISCKFAIKPNIQRVAIGNRQEVIFGNLKMKLYIINSGSLGNGYLLEASDGEQLLIEAGRPLKEFSKYGNLKRSRARGMLISHEHG